MQSNSNTTDGANTRLGIFVGEENWDFFDEIFADLVKHYECEVFKRKIYDFPFLYGRLNRWAYQSGIRRVLQRNDICFFEWSSELLARASYMPKQCRIVTRLHSFELYKWAPIIKWNAVDKVILVSNAMKNLFGEQYPAHAHKTIVINNGRALDAFKPPDKREFAFNLGMLANISPVKRIYEIVLMLYDLTGKGYDARLFIAGEPRGDLRYAAAIHRLVEQLNLQERVVFDGFVVDTPAWLQKIDVFISNSFWEGQQVALLEAMASGCHCLSHFWDGAEEVLPLENLYFSETDLRNALIDYSEKSDAEKLRCQARLRSIACEKFDIERTKVQIRQAISNLAANDY